MISAMRAPQLKNAKGWATRGTGKKRLGRGEGMIQGANLIFFFLTGFGSCTSLTFSKI